MNTAPLISRRFVVGMGPRLTAPVRYSSTAMKPRERTFMRAVFTTGTVVTATGVLYAATRSGGRVGTRYAKKNSSLDSSKWFLEGADVNKWLVGKAR
ncbi:uncharacterized protein A1O9_12759 [Exophiala aquamarina CBS 119918]|uniref:Uncharacterized protein n=1 Tax=Exophiala aquamarina CBS 119918 TaxID=1182545 RepID=A0A072P692_9EURO|nr:uncharacterized protein A1O9_12759 [Exophiala aquamarina CBS 119918]KEF51145.1 hypothetical protein A1O9_12759 [Exophiala aquamarina CBS 119918]